VYGFALVQEPRLHSALIRQWRLALAPALCMTAAVFAFAWPEDVLARLPVAYSPAYVALWMLYTFGTWCWLIVILGAASALWHYRPRFLDHALRLVYPFYLLHHVVIVAVAYVVVRRTDALPASPQGGEPRCHIVRHLARAVRAGRAPPAPGRSIVRPSPVD
jgi:hypothetical protein